MVALRSLLTVTSAVLASPQLGIETGSVPCKHERICEHRCHSLPLSRSGSAERSPEVTASREPGADIPPDRKVRELSRGERDRRSDPNLRPVTFFIFFAGAAGAGIVATDLVVAAMDSLNRSWFFASIEREL